ncbi:hypothetical protein SAMN00777080_4299 [Aquiflexum balticum DSM 16537]|uniref:Uncharacterized protein n=1 Tax=Aquiflexum balticum DSM 16537 TaxID=758820 RepID=A0A1W2H9S3_9BACT|nr:hypothetical protein SAMN00777080_4299 [Aquiflexum balticum DSM 16537]
MFRRYISFFFLTLAQAMLLGHSFFPHHHHDPLNFYGHHEYPCEHHHGNDHDTGEEHSSDIFSMIQHGQNGIECISCPHLDQPVQKQLFEFESTFAEKNGLHKSFRISYKNPPPYSTSFYSKISELLPDSLRAPPSQV